MGLNQNKIFVAYSYINVSNRIEGNKIKNHKVKGLLQWPSSTNLTERERKFIINNKIKLVLPA